ncbi:flagellar associated protein [Raphidocelis subcapitata]|uniref:Flagellar associated protein n=1 Tax=Raphidocelis subcapitata TaxID=307507 RepID=A0A2V0NQX7_9CHLO|nr:flagellar associated protein [Raphidocelis subcapitata]|eukprot:GBF90044.1 flagellar associated protein [Raphidocelis subcapitata]
MLRSGFGQQVKSNQASQPIVGFGTSVRETSLKQYLSPEHAKAVSGNNSQGPVYRLYSSVGPQPESTMQSPGTMSFGTAQRLPKPGKSGVPIGLGEQKESIRSTEPRAVFGTCTRDGQAKTYMDPELMKTYYGKESPPPGSYNVPSAVVSTKESAPSIKIGTSLRALDYAVMRARHLPGPGQYKTPPGVGHQTLSSKKTLPVTFISKEHEKSCYGENTPGPITAGPYAGVGPQLLSTRHSSPKWGFGTGRRLKDYINDSPGVGSYYA